MNKRMTLEFFDHPEGGVKVAVYQDGKWLFETHGWSDYGALQRVANLYVFHKDKMNDALNRRAD